jgi:tetratricopeptide (TPR) repeat protein
MALALAEEVDLSRELGLVHTALGSAYSGKAQYDDSRTEFERAVVLLSEFEDKLSEASLYYEYALMLSADGNPDRDAAKAKELLEKALGMFEESGMGLWTAKCRKALEGLDG